MNTEGLKDTLILIAGYIVSLITLVRVQDILGIVVALLTSVYLIVIIYLKLKKGFKHETKRNKEKGKGGKSRSKTNKKANS